MTVLVTRPQPDADMVALQLEKAGIRSMVAPMMTIEFLQVDPIAEDAVLAFTSANGVRGFANQFGQRENLVFVVGQATAEEAADVGFRHIIMAFGNVDFLLEKIKSELEPGKKEVIHISGEHVRGDLVAELIKSGYKARRVVVYSANEATVLGPEVTGAIRSGEIDKVLFFSPRTCEIFVKLMRQYNLMSYCKHMSANCMSESVAGVLRAYEWQSIEVYTEDLVGNY